MSVDHGHNGDRAVRGILCHKCNILLGAAEDDVERLAKAITYLRAPPAVAVGIVGAVRARVSWVSSLCSVGCLGMHRIVIFLWMRHGSSRTIRTWPSSSQVGGLRTRG